MAETSKQFEKVQLVVARDYLCFKLWCDKNRISPRNTSVRFIQNSYDFRGYHPNSAEIVSVCDWYAVRPFEQAQRLNEEIRYLTVGLGMNIRRESCTS